MRVNLTIKKMLAMLVMMGTFFVLVLAINNFISSNRLHKSQLKLTQIVLPLQTINQEIEAAVASFIERQGRIAGANNIEELDQLTDRQRLEKIFQGSQEDLKDIASDLDELTQGLASLSKSYKDFLDNDAAYLQSTRTVLDLQEKETEEIAELDRLGSDLQKDAESIAGKINFSSMKKGFEVRKHLKPDGDSAKLRNAVNELLLGDVKKVQKACNDIQLAIASLGSLGRQILLVRDQDSLNSLKANKIGQASSLLDGSLQTLKKDTKDQTGLADIIQRIEQNAEQLKGTLTEGSHSASRLREQLLVEQNNAQQLRDSLMESTVAIKASLKGMQTVAAQIRTKAEEDVEQIKQTVAFITIIVGLAAVILMLTIGTLISRRIIVPINKAVSFADLLAKGDFSKKLEVTQDDEIGALGKAINSMAANLATTFRDINNSATTLFSHSEELSTISHKMTTNTEQTVMKTNSVATAVEEMSVSMQSVASSTETANSNMSLVSNATTEITSNVANIATASDQMIASINEVAHTSEKARQISSQAVSSVNNASRQMEGLNSAAEDINSVTAVIMEIAEQTKLLALNATIEAARAGESGKGFAVVANEVKELASQTNNAVSDINLKIKAMQEATSQSLQDIDNIHTVVDEISTIVNVIASAVEEQSISNKDIADNIGHSSRGLADVNSKVGVSSSEISGVARIVADASNVAKEIARDIVEVNRAANEISKNSETIDLDAQSLHKIASKLNDIMKKFTI